MAEHMSVYLLPQPSPFARLLDDLPDGAVRERLARYGDSDVVARGLPGPPLQQPPIQVVPTGVVTDDHLLSVPLANYSGPALAQVEAGELQVDQLSSLPRSIHALRKSGILSAKSRRT